MALSFERAREIAARVPTDTWAILELEEEVPWLEDWLRTAPVAEVAAWTRRTLANAVEEPLRVPETAVVEVQHPGGHFMTVEITYQEAERLGLLEHIREAGEERPGQN